MQCLQYKTDQQQDLKKVERITQMFFALFSKGELPEGMSIPMGLREGANFYAILSSHLSFSTCAGDAMQIDQPQQTAALEAKGKKSRKKG